MEIVTYVNFKIIWILTENEVILVFHSMFHSFWESFFIQLSILDDRRCSWMWNVCKILSFEMKLTENQVQKFQIKFNSIYLVISHRGVTGPRNMPYYIPKDKIVRHLLLTPLDMHKGQTNVRNKIHRFFFYFVFFFVFFGRVDQELRIENKGRAKQSVSLTFHPFFCIEHNRSFSRH